MLNAHSFHTLTVSGIALPNHLGQPMLVPIRLSGTETLGELFEYTLEFKTADGLRLVSSIAANIDRAKLLGTEVTICIELEGNGTLNPTTGEGAINVGAGVREITGLVTEAALLREEERTAFYQLTLRPWLWLASQNKDVRLFQDMTVVELTDAVLSAYPFPVERRLIADYPKRDVQRQH